MLTLKNDSKRHLVFKDAQDQICRLNLAITTKKKNPVFTIRGDIDNNGSGQVLGDIVPKNKYQKWLIDVWEKYHLNDLNAGTKKQMEALAKKPEKFEELAKTLKFDHYEASCFYLNNITANREPITAIEREALTRKIDALKDQIKKLQELSETFFDEIKTAGSVNNWFLNNFAPFTEHFKLQSIPGTTKIGKFYDNLSQIISDRKKYRLLTERLASTYEKQLKELKLTTLLYDVHPKTGEPYKYGSGWLYFPLPENFDRVVNKLCDKIAEIDTTTDFERLPLTEQFLQKTQTTIKTKYFKYEFYFSGDKEPRHIFKITLKNPRGQYTFTFGQSIASGSTKPAIYDVLACLDPYSPESFEDFCDEFGYKENNQSKRIFNACQKQAENLTRIYTPEELEELAQIR